MHISTALLLRPLALAALCAAGAAHANIAFVTSSGTQPFPTAARDTFSDLAINSNLGALSITRSVDAFRYALATTYGDAANSSLYAVPAAGTGAVSTGWYTDSLLFTLLSNPIYAFGGNFFGTNVLGEVASGALTITATDIQGTSRSTTISGNSLTAFTGILSDVPLRLVTVSITTPNTAVFASADNVLLSAVPEPQSWAMLLAGGVMMLSLARRRRG